MARLGDQSFRLTAAEPNLRWLQDNAEGMDVTVEDVSESRAARSLQGPAARAILGDVDLRYFWHKTAQVGGIPVGISRTGYTGDLGYELWVAVKDAVPLWDALIEAGTPHGIVPAGMLALDVARIEAGLMLIDVDYVPARKALIPAQTSSPYELDLGWTVDLKKERFIGRQALAEDVAANMEAAGGTYFVTAVVGSLDDWFRPAMTDASWSELFAQIEATLPESVRLTSFQPQEDREGRLVMNLGVQARRVQDLESFLDALEKTGRFYEVLAAQEETDTDGLINAVVEGVYVVPSEEPAPEAAAATPRTGGAAGE